MTTQTADVVDKVEKTLHDGSYYTTRIVNSPTINCCDVIATSSDRQTSLVTKVVENIDGTDKDILTELLLLGYFLKATPLLVGFFNRRHELEDNTIYFRLDGHIIALNFNTFNQVIRYNIHPQRMAKRGGYMYQINGEELRELREEHMFSRKSLSERLQVSTKTIAEYERHKLIRSQVHHVEILEDIFQQELKQSVCIFDIPKKNKKIVQNRPSSHQKNAGIAEEISEILSDLGIFQYWTSKSPFDVFLVIPGAETRLQIVSGIFSNIQHEDLERLHKIAQIVKIRNKMGVVRAIVEDRADAKECKKIGIVPVESKKLKEAKESKEVVKILSSKQ